MQQFHAFEQPTYQQINEHTHVERNIEVQMEIVPHVKGKLYRLDRFDRLPNQKIH